MENKAAEHIENKEKTLKKPSIARRFSSGAIDFGFALIIFFGLFLLTYFCIFPSLNYFSQLDEIQERYVDSHLYIKNSYTISIVDDIIKDDTDLKEAYDDRIIYYYTNDERALKANKIESYENAKIASGLFIKDESDEIVLKEEVERSLLLNFYQKEYSSALDFLSEDPYILNRSNNTFLIMYFGIVLNIFVATLIFYLIIPLCLKNNNTLGQLFLKIGLAKTKTNSKPTIGRVILRYFILILISLVAPALLYLKMSYFSIFIIALNLILMCVTKQRIGFHDVLSGTYLVDLRTEYIASRNHRSGDVESEDRISKLLEK